MLASRRLAHLEPREAALNIGHDLDTLDDGATRPRPAGLEHGRDLGLGTFDHSLDRTVPAIAHPAAQTALDRSPLHPEPIANALHPTLDPDLNRSHASLSCCRLPPAAKR
jgi:hypothetical protein